MGAISTEFGKSGATMNGWLTVAIVLISLLIIAVIALRVGASRLWRYLVMLTLAVPLCRPVARNVMGDISGIMAQTLQGSRLVIL